MQGWNIDNIAVLLSQDAFSKKRMIDLLIVDLAHHIFIMTDVPSHCQDGGILDNKYSKL